jgi:hypothetical protein
VLASSPTKPPVALLPKVTFVYPCCFRPGAFRLTRASTGRCFQLRAARAPELSGKRSLCSRAHYRQLVHFPLDLRCLRHSLGDMQGMLRPVMYPLSTANIIPFGFLLLCFWILHPPCIPPTSCTHPAPINPCVTRPLSPVAGLVLRRIQQRCGVAHVGRGRIFTAIRALWPHSHQRHLPHGKQEALLEGREKPGRFSRSLPWRREAEDKGSIGGGIIRR